MKLHIECLQEKLDSVVKENDISKKELEKTNKVNTEKHQNELKKL